MQKAEKLGRQNLNSHCKDSCKVILEVKLPVTIFLKRVVRRKSRLEKKSENTNEDLSCMLNSVHAMHKHVA